MQVYTRMMFSCLGFICIGKHSGSAYFYAYVCEKERWRKRQCLNLRRVQSFFILPWQQEVDGTLKKTRISENDTSGKQKIAKLCFTPSTGIDAAFCKSFISKVER
ncbi:hypothetical protein GOODEAATRI_005307 [Goodea atripinnis]|uniref:Uncharacterized protein n=1 Tax=Goodea atripinnis TaxID=208336 RepID=A0ABV0PVY6_9TELE